MEIERKFLLKRLPQQISHCENANLKQAYLCTDPVIRIRRKNNQYILTYKSAGLMEREEIEVPLNQKSFEHLLKKCDGNIIAKTRYNLPLDSGLIVEIDEFHDGFDGLIIAEVEFPDRETAENFVPPMWLNHEVTNDPKFQNSNLCMMSENERITLLKELYWAH